MPSVVNNLRSDSLDWALQHLDFEGDGDLFPKPFEIDIIKQQWSRIKPVLEKIDITNHSWSPVRTVLVPKDEVSFRRACQLDPIDALLFGAIIWEIGGLIEARRRPVSEGRVFSYRFDPQAPGSLFAKGNPWGNFWTASSQNALKGSHVVILDLSDFYNQVYHHTIENQLDACGVPSTHKRAILNLLTVPTLGVSRGVPIGPHGAHVLAELSLIPLDDYLALKGYTFCRFVDDIHIVCGSRSDAQNIIFEVADFVDKSQKLLINKQKTEILSTQDLRSRAALMLLDNPINAQEQQLLEVVKRHAGPYTRVALSSLSTNELAILNTADIDGILRSYLEPQEPDFVRFRWFLRRLAQTGIPTGISFIVSNLRKALPAIGEIAAYLNSARDSFQGNWIDVGQSLIVALDEPVVTNNEYLQLVLLSMFSRMAPLNHFETLVQRFQNYKAAGKREVLLAAAAAPASTSWIQSLKGSLGEMDPWQRRSLLFAAQRLPKDERRFWFKNIASYLNSLEKAIVDVVKSL